VTEAIFFNELLIAWTLLTIPVFTLLLFVRAPFGRHTRDGWGPTLSNKLSWILMESPAVWWFALVFLSGGLEKSAINYFFFVIWMVHYIHRDLIFPLRLHDRGKRMPVMVGAMAFIFQIVNCYLNGAYLGRLGRTYEISWVSDPRFVIGVVLFFGGMAINLRADNTLLALRGPSESGYKIPYGGLYRWISCPNYLGEILQWTGWAVATWSLVGMSFALWTAANLVPRAIAHHRWYRQEFADYPGDRRALLPGLL
jgi:3-oxo-5-alpha-steroid 4-dehydrogenase 1